MDDHKENDVNMHLTLMAKDRQKVIAKIEKLERRLQTNKMKLCKNRNTSKRKIRQLNNRVNQIEGSNIMENDDEDNDEDDDYMDADDQSDENDDDDHDMEGADASDSNYLMVIN